MPIVPPRAGALFILGCGLHGASPAQSPPPPAAPAPIQQMAGTWAVQQRMCFGPGQEAPPLPAAIAQRRLRGNAYLEESMEPDPAAAAGPDASFVRTAYFNFNAVSRRYEYASLDTRAPQLMVEQGAGASAGAVHLVGGSFVAPQWGPAKNATFHYRLDVGPVEADRQVVQLYLTPQTGPSRAEFLAFEYVYTRRK